MTQNEGMQNMSQQATRETQMKRHTRVRPWVTLIGAIVLAASLASVIVLIIVADATTPPALLPMPESVPENPGKTSIVSTPAQQLDDAVEFNVRSKDRSRVLPLLDQLAEQQGGHRLNLQDSYGVAHYVLPADTAQWLTGIDVSNGKEAYAALSDPPATDTAQPLTTVAITVDAPWGQRKVFMNLFLAAVAAVAAVDLTISAVRIGIVLSNET